MLRRDRPLVHQFLLAVGLGAAALLPAIAGLAQEPDSQEPSHLRSVTQCPSDLNQLTTWLLADLPSYANRVASRSLSLDRPEDRPGLSPPNTVIVAGPPDFTPIDLPRVPTGEALDSAPDAPETSLQQVFFTTLERQYWQNQAVLLQNYHWLFLVQSQDGWHMALLHSSLDIYPAAHRAPTPPQESSDGIVGQAVRLWLRDCRAGAVFPPSAAEYAAPPDVSIPPVETPPLETTPAETTPAETPPDSAPFDSTRP